MPADIDVTNASRVGEQLLSALVPGVSAVIVDLTGTAFCDCARSPQLVAGARAFES
jgi:anti-anti-sigma regulatory factor